MIQPFDQPVLVTRPYLPPLADYQQGLAEIWRNQWLTNAGPVLQRYTRKLEAYLDTPNVCLFSNGTLALQIALQGMNIQGEVITTPFTFVATTHCLTWNRITPVFVDIDPDLYTLDPDAVEAAITPRTEAILAVHVFGTPCHLHRLEAIARKHGIALIYDAAHAFGVRVNGNNIAGYGDCSMFSFHATKLYHSIEGGALTFHDPALKKRFDYLKNFGFENETEVVMPGTNAKMNEMQALMGELVLRDMDAIIAKRRLLAERYVAGLAEIPGIRVAAGVTGSSKIQPPAAPAAVTPNYAYMPIEVIEGQYPLSRDALYERLKTYNVFARRYFYPLITDFACYRGRISAEQLPVAEKVARQIMTLPIYHDLDPDDVTRICQILRAESGG